MDCLGICWARLETLDMYSLGGYILVSPVRFCFPPMLLLWFAYLYFYVVPSVPRPPNFVDLTPLFTDDIYIRTVADFSYPSTFPIAQTRNSHLFLGDPEYTSTVV